MPKLSLVVPCYNEQEALRPFMLELSRVTSGLGDVETEVILVDDGSSDETLRVIRELAGEYEMVRYLSFSRNFGKESAMLAGFAASRGDYVAVMDADLQDPPALLPDMLKAVREEGYDCAGSRRTTRKGEPPIRSFFARMFYRFINMISHTQLVDGARDYKLLSRKAVDALLAMPEYNRFSKGLYEWIGFRTKWFEYQNVERVAGETKWSFWKLFKYSLEGIVAFTTMPLALASLLGMICMLVALVIIVSLSVRQMMWHSSVDGWTSMVCIIVLLSGLQLFCVGIIGQYISKMYLEIKRRPHYIVAESSDEK
ncbi:MAG: glycosyltransferase family 2 protein [Akkermansia sp.]|nr:glycosyltransferase family 2 protein [Akkermansia sp.]MBR2313310.1 glycosyltransferase family 2 protein [Akkermansia sp.]